MNKNKAKNKKGSLLVGVAIVFFLISSIAIAIISRSLQGAVLTTDSRKGYATYQNSDSSAENFLNKLKNFDDNTDSTGKIPENTNASELCVGGITCYWKDAITQLDNTKKISDIFNFKVSDSSSDVTRTIIAPVLDRTDGKLSESSFTVKKCDVIDCGVGFNPCDIFVKINDSINLSDDISNYEIRMSKSKALSEIGWTKVAGDVTGGYFDDNMHKSVVLHNVPSGVYYFTIKARNRKPFSLDSPYLGDSNGNAYDSEKVDISSCP